MGFGQEIRGLVPNGLRGKGPGADAPLHIQLLEQTLDVMKNDPRLSFGEAMQRTGVDLSSVPVPILRDIVQSQPPEVQLQISQWASSGDAPRNANAFANAGAQGPAAPATNPAAGNPAAPASAANGVGPTGTPPGHAYGRVADAPAADPGLRALPNVVTHTVANAASQLIQRVFSGEGARTETAQNQTAVPARTAAGDAPRADTSQTVAMPRNANGEAHRAEHAKQQSLPNAALTRGADNALRHNAVQQSTQPLQARGDGRSLGQAVASQASSAPASAAQAAQPQGAAQASAFGARESAAHAAQGASQAPTSAGAQPQGHAQAVPLAQGRPETLAGQQQALPQQASTTAQARPDAPAINTQAAVPQQAVPLAQARPDALAAQLQAQGQTQLAPQAPVPAQVVPQLAGLAMVANPQAPVVNPQLGQNVVPAAPGAENAASQARNALLAPAGHTLAGFLRRDHRGSQTLRNKPLGWALALVPGLRKHRAEGEAEAVSFHWLFWLLIIVAYGALAAALIVMIPSGGRLLTDKGAPSMGVYALILGGIAAIASWLIGRRLTKRS